MSNKRPDGEADVLPLSLSTTITPPLDPQPSTSTTTPVPTSTVIVVPPTSTTTVAVTPEQANPPKPAQETSTSSSLSSAARATVDDVTVVIPQSTVTLLPSSSGSSSVPIVPVQVVTPSSASSSARVAISVVSVKPSSSSSIRAVPSVSSSSSLLRSIVPTRSSLTSVDIPTSSDAATASPENQTATSSSSKSGVVAGSVVGALVGLFIIALLLVKCHRRRTKAAASHLRDRPFESDNAAAAAGGWRSTFHSLSFYSPSIRPRSSFQQIVDRPISSADEDNRTSVVSQNMAGRWNFGNPTPADGSGTVSQQQMTTADGFLSPSFEPREVLSNDQLYAQQQQVYNTSADIPQLFVEPPTQRSSADMYAFPTQQGPGGLVRSNTQISNPGDYGMAVSDGWESAPQQNNNFQHQQQPQQHQIYQV